MRFLEIRDRELKAWQVATLAADSITLFREAPVLPPTPLSYTPHPDHALLCPAFQNALQDILDHPLENCIDEHTYLYLLEGNG